jgi:hypothetical protein
VTEYIECNWREDIFEFQVSLRDQDIRKGMVLYFPKFYPHTQTSGMNGNRKEALGNGAWSAFMCRVAGKIYVSFTKYFREPIPKAAVIIWITRIVVAFKYVFLVTAIGQ